MSEQRFMATWEADFRANKAARQLIEAVNTFNSEHPDPNAQKIADTFDYLTENFFVQLCGSILSEHYIVVPPEDEGKKNPPT